MLFTRVEAVAALPGQAARSYMLSLIPAPGPLSAATTPALLPPPPPPRRRRPPQAGQTARPRAWPGRAGRTGRRRPSAGGAARLPPSRCVVVFVVVVGEGGVWRVRGGRRSSSSPGERTRLRPAIRRSSLAHYDDPRTSPESRPRCAAAAARAPRAAPGRPTRRGTRRRPQKGCQTARSRGFFLFFCVLLDVAGLFLKGGWDVCVRESGP